MYTKADKKRFGLCDQNLKIRKEPFRSFYDRGNMSLFFFSLSNPIYSPQCYEMGFK